MLLGFEKAKTTTINPLFPRWKKEKKTYDMINVMSHGWHQVNIENNNKLHVGKKILNIIPSNITTAILDPPHEFNTTTKLCITKWFYVEEKNVYCHVILKE
jgi:hypothetical protein